MMEKCWEKPCICYFNRRSVKNGRRFLYKITASIFMRGLQEKGRILKKIFCFSNFAGQEEEGISSFFKISGKVKSISAFPDLGIAPRLHYTVRHNNGKQILFLCNKYKIKAAAPETLPSLNLAKDWGKRLY